MKSPQHESDRAFERAGHNPDFTVAALPGLNHLFQQAKNGGPAEYAITEETISPQALRLVCEWLLAQAR